VIRIREKRWVGTSGSSARFLFEQVSGMSRIDFLVPLTLSHPWVNHLLYLVICAWRGAGNRLEDFF
jgi:hypothetical protein